MRNFMSIPWRVKLQPKNKKKLMRRKDKISKASRKRNR